VNDKLQELIMAEGKQTNKQTKMIGNDNCEQKSLDCETRHYNKSNNSMKLTIMIIIIIIIIFQIRIIHKTNNLRGL
jgi:hypothetical protein